MKWRDEQLVPISALQHYAFCPRQCALIHVEQTFDENVFTLRGHRVHQKVHTPGDVFRSGVRTERAVPLWSDRLGLIGQADAIEFKGSEPPFPVEYKSGRRRRAARRADEIQLCAQAICLEEMLSVSVSQGALFYHGSRQRQLVSFDAALRREVEMITRAVRTMFEQVKLPPAVADARCRYCSLKDACMPFAVEGRPSG